MSSVPNSPGDGRQYLVSPRALADLARAGSAILRQPSMQVAYEVHHVRDRPGYLYDVVRGGFPHMAEGPGSDPPNFVETLTTSAYGLGLVIGTRTVGSAGGLSPAVTGLAPVAVLPRDPEGISRVFRGTAVPNVSFIHESARVFEGVIAVEMEPVSLQLRHGRAIRDVIKEIANVAVTVADAPILSLQSPVQLPHHHFVGEDIGVRGIDWPRSAALAVRFAVALERPSAKLRFSITDRLARFCTERGFGLWLADSRPGYRAGNWFMICRHNKEVARRGFTKVRDPHGVSKVYSCLPVTFVGPARIGSTHAILEYLSGFPHLGVLACSGTTIDDIAFVHLQLTTSSLPSGGLDRFNELLDAEVSVDRDTLSVLRRIVPLLDQLDEDRVSQEVKQRLAERAGDYQALVGPAVPVSNTDLGRRALWVSWEVEGRDTPLRVPFQALFDALRDLSLFRSPNPSDVSGDPNVEYLICRDVGGSALRGKGKVSLPENVAEANIGQPDLQSGLSVFSATIESAWRQRLDQSARARELTVSWLEYWLGHWTLPLD